ncbi:hypothetical protein SBA4_2150016 [Candidatus Sulfopaludibacter sp. SbA4]|nr:hypothetical protein SBA4_2150016 [Candidatus Sulfopaludibacter sp. SbA4]
MWRMQGVSPARQRKVKVSFHFFGEREQNLNDLDIFE